MSDVSAGRKAADTVDEADVIRYLNDHPDVLANYPELLTRLVIPHPTGAATSLVERQVSLLRGENQALKAKIDELVGIARENEDLNQRFHRLALELLDTGQLRDVLALVQDQVQTFFYTDFVCFRFLPGISGAGDALDGLLLDADSGILDTVKPWIARRKPVCGRLDDKVHRQLFGDDAQIGSSALVPLYHTADFGLLCLGSQSGGRFELSMGTIFLQQLGELVSNRLKHLLSAS